jgi:hypothetical protein
VISFWLPRCLDGLGRFHQGSLCGVGRGSGARERHEIKVTIGFTILYTSLLILLKGTVGYIVKGGAEASLARHGAYNRVGRLRVSDSAS